MSGTPSPNYVHLTGAGTYTVHNGPGMLQFVTVSTSGGSVVGYDSLNGSGRVIFSIGSSTPPGTYMYNAVVSKGITLVVGSTVDINVVWAASS